MYLTKSLMANLTVNLLPACIQQLHRPHGLRRSVLVRARDCYIMTNSGALCRMQVKCRYW